MKKSNSNESTFASAKVLSRAELKRVMGGVHAYQGGCSSSSECPTNQSCCSDYSNPSQTVYSCQHLALMELPNGTSTVTCPSYDAPL